MSRYEVLLFLHVAAAIVWLGSGFAVQMFAIRADRAKDAAAMLNVVEGAEWLANRVFVPASLATFVFGLGLAFEGPWSFDMLWIDLGLAGYAATFLTGILFLSPQAKKLGELIAAHGAMHPAVGAQTRRLFLISRVELVVRFAVVIDMTLKPTGGDVGTLLVMAGAIVAAAALGIWRFQATAVEAAPEAASASETV